MIRQLLLACCFVGCVGGETGETDTDTDTDTDTGLISQWRDRSIETSATLNAVYTGGTGAWIVGSDGGFWRMDSGAANLIDTSISEDFYGLWGQGDDSDASLVMVGTSGSILSYAPVSGFVANDLGTANFYGIAGSSVADLTGVAWAGAYHLGGGEWQFEGIPGNGRLNGIWANAEVAVGVGEGGLIALRQDSTWTIIESPVTEDLQGIHGLSATDLWIVGQNGTILRYKDGEVTEQNSMTAVTLWGVWQAPETKEVYVVGNNGTALVGSGTEASEGSETGVEFEELDTGVEENLYSVYGTTWDNVFAVGNRGTVIRYRGPVVAE